MALIFPDSFVKEAAAIDISQPDVELALQSVRQEVTLSEPDYWLSLCDFEDRFLLVGGTIKAEERTVIDCYPLSSEFVESAGTLDPLLLLQEFADRFGVTIEIGRQRSKFIYDVIVPITAEDVQRGIQIVSVRKPQHHALQHNFMMKVEQRTDGRFARIALAYCIDITLYHEWLEVGDLPAATPYHSCFISYGEPDADFAKRLRNELERYGVDCWLYSLDATFGQRSWSEIADEVHERPRMIIVCSVESLLRDGVRRELELAIDQDPNKLIPISLDDIWLESGFSVTRGDHDLKPFLEERNFARFTKRNFGLQVRRLLTALKKEEGS